MKKIQVELTKISNAWDDIIKAEKSPLGRVLRKKQRDHLKKILKQIIKAGDPNSGLSDLSEMIYNVIYGDCHYGIGVSMRSDGKTSWILDEMVFQYFVTGRPSVYLRRWLEDNQGVFANTLFNHISEFIRICAETVGEPWTCATKYRRCWYMAYYDENGVLIRADEPFCYCFDISSAEHLKGLGDMNWAVCLFDEFIATKIYLKNEYILFKSVLSSIARTGKNGLVKVFMMGNLANPVGVYFKEMPLDFLPMTQPGDRVILEGNSLEINGQIETLRYYVCHTSDEVRSTGKKVHKPSDILFATDNTQESMITAGVVALEDKPHNSQEWKPREEKVKFYIRFDGFNLGCILVAKEDGTAPFLFVHTKTTDIAQDTTRIVYHNEYDTRPNWRRKITRPEFDWERVILNVIRSERVFFSDNYAGAIFDSYLRWCGVAV